MSPLNHCLLSGCSELSLSARDGDKLFKAIILRAIDKWLEHFNFHILHRDERKPTFFEKGTTFFRHLIKLISILPSEMRTVVTCLKLAFVDHSWSHVSKANVTPQFHSFCVVDPASYCSFYNGHPISLVKRNFSSNDGKLQIHWKWRE